MTPRISTRSWKLAQVILHNLRVLCVWESHVDGGGCEGGAEGDDDDDDQKMSFMMVLIIIGGGDGEVTQSGSPNVLKR